jgi:hypothetical protein
MLSMEFAFRCLVRMHDLLSSLELVLGPGTADLSARIGLNSGPVTAGVLEATEHGSNFLATPSMLRLAWKALERRAWFIFRRRLPTC